MAVVATVNQIVAEVLHAPNTGGPSRVNQIVAEVLHSPPIATARVSQIVVEVLQTPAPPPSARVSQLVAETLHVAPTEQWPSVVVNNNYTRTARYAGTIPVPMYPTPYSPINTANSFGFDECNATFATSSRAFTGGGASQFSHGYISRLFTPLSYYEWSGGTVGGNSSNSQACWLADNLVWQQRKNLMSSLAIMGASGTSRIAYIGTSPDDNYGASETSLNGMLLQVPDVVSKAPGFPWSGTKIVTRAASFWTYFENPNIYLDIYDPSYGSTFRRPIFNGAVLDPFQIEDMKIVVGDWNTGDKFIHFQTNEPTPPWNSTAIYDPRNNSLVLTAVDEPTINAVWTDPAAFGNANMYLTTRGLLVNFRGVTGLQGNYNNWILFDPAFENWYLISPYKGQSSASTINFQSSNLSGTFDLNGVFYLWDVSTGEVNTNSPLDIPFFSPQIINFNTTPLKLPCLNPCMPISIGVPKL